LLDSLVSRRDGPYDIAGLENSEHDPPREKEDEDGS